MRADRPAGRADDPHGNRLLSSERISNGQHPFSDLQPVRIPEWHVGKRLVRFDLQQRNIGFSVPTHQPRLVLALIGQMDQQSFPVSSLWIGRRDDVSVRQSTLGNIAVRQAQGFGIKQGLGIAVAVPSEDNERATQ
jgi:hypothetical protein